MTTGEKRVPMRMCVMCRKRLPKAVLTRFAARGGETLADPRQVLPGRGSYLCSSPACRERFAAKEARKKGV